MARNSTRLINFFGSSLQKSDGVQIDPLSNLIGLAIREFRVLKLAIYFASEKEPNYLACTRMGSTFLTLYKHLEKENSRYKNIDLFPVSRKAASLFALGSKDKCLQNLSLSLRDNADLIKPSCSSELTLAEWLATQYSIVSEILAVNSENVLIDSRLHGTTFSLLSEKESKLKFILLFQSINKEASINHLSNTTNLLGMFSKTSLLKPKSWILASWHLLETILESPMNSVDHYFKHGNAILLHDKDCRNLEDSPSEYLKKIIESEALYKGYAGHLSTLNLFMYLFFPRRNDALHFFRIIRSDDLHRGKHSASLVDNRNVFRTLWIPGSIRMRFKVIAPFIQFLYFIYLFFVPFKVKKFARYAAIKFFKI